MAANAMDDHDDTFSTTERSMNATSLMIPLNPLIYRVNQFKCISVIRIKNALVKSPNY